MKLETITALASQRPPPPTSRPVTREQLQSEISDRAAILGIPAPKVQSSAQGAAMLRTLDAVIQRRTPATPAAPVATSPSSKPNAKQLVALANVLSAPVAWRGNQVDEAETFDRVERAAFQMHIELPGGRSGEAMEAAGIRRFPREKISTTKRAFVQQFVNAALKT